MRCVETVTEPDIDGSVSISSYSLGKLVLKIPQSWLYSYMKRVTVRAIRGMRLIIIIIMIMTVISCSTSKRAKPCKQCPQFTYEKAN